MSGTGDFHDAVPRCPRCLNHHQVEKSGGWGHRWFCPACELVFVGTAAEQHAESRRRAELEAQEVERLERGVA